MNPAQCVLPVKGEFKEYWGDVGGTLDRVRTSLYFEL